MLLLWHHVLLLWHHVTPLSACVTLWHNMSPCDIICHPVTSNVTLWHHMSCCDIICHAMTSKDIPLTSCVNLVTSCVTRLTSYVTLSDIIMGARGYFFYWTFPHILVLSNFYSLKLRNWAKVFPVKIVFLKKSTYYYWSVIIFFCRRNCKETKINNVFDQP